MRCRPRTRPKPITGAHLKVIQQTIVLEGRTRNRFTASPHEFPLLEEMVRMGLMEDDPDVIWPRCYRATPAGCRAAGLPVPSEDQWIEINKHRAYSLGD
jgi:hypothetical protein